MRGLSLKAVQRRTCKKRDAWWTVLLVDPVATRLVCVLARWRFVTPNGVTWAALGLGILSAVFFVEGDPRSLAIGALIYHLSFILDCIDGKLARLRGTGSVFGGWLDYVFDRVRVLVCAIALMGGQYLRTDNEAFLFAAFAVIFLDMLRYVDALQIHKMRQAMRAKIEKVTEQNRAIAGHPAGHAQEVLFIEDVLRENPGLEPEQAAVVGQGQVVDLHAKFRSHFPWYGKVRRLLLKSRIRPHLFSGIEFQMFVFIIGPLTGQIMWTVAVSAVLLGLFELVIMYKFWLSTRDFSREMAKLTPPQEAVDSLESVRRGRHRRPLPEPTPRRDRITAREQHEAVRVGA
ncbi:CDP-alcohol phosphatidyltransferase family protein [Streptomyces sp. T-3]|nr:CDP-alcohol phosphatidyltransferase family protein [Streptomyces sp. T-3]